MFPLHASSSDELKESSTRLHGRNGTWQSMGTRHKIDFRELISQRWILSPPGSWTYTYLCEVSRLAPLSALDVPCTKTLLI
jgi:hypothetical protein